MAKYGTVYVDVDAGDTSGLDRKIQESAHRAASSFGGLFRAGGQVLGDLTQIAGTAALGVAGIGVAATGVGIAFNREMSGVAAVANATAAELGLLRQSALDAGAATVFSASEAAEAQTELAKAGIGVSDILGGALRGSLDLAAAGQLDLATSATIAAQAMDIFGLRGDEVTHVADVLAAGANKSAADVGQLGTAMSQAGLVADQTGLSLEQTVGVLSLFADNALIGSDAGTSLKTMLQRLTPISGESAEMMAELGFTAFDAAGNFESIDVIAQRLHDSLSGLTEEQRQLALTQLFGSDAIRAATLLYEAGAAGVQEYTSAVNDQGAAQRVAATQLDNLAGDLEAFSGSAETAGIHLSDLWDDVLRSGVQATTGLTNVFNDFAGTIQFELIQARISGLTGGIDDLSDALELRLRTALHRLDLVDIERGFDRLEDGAHELHDAIEPIAPLVLGVGASVATMAARSIPILGGFVPAISPITGVLGGVILSSDEAKDSLGRLGTTMLDVARDHGPAVADAVGGLAEELGDGLGGAIDALRPGLEEAGDILLPLLADAADKVGPPLGDLIEAAGELAGEVLPELAATVDGLSPFLDVAAGGLGLLANVTGLLADNANILTPALVAVAGSIGAISVGKAVSEMTAFKAVLDNIALQKHLGQMEGMATAGLNLGSAAGVAKSGMGGLSTALSSINPWVIGVGVGVGVLATVLGDAAQRKAEFRRAVREATDALRDEEGVLQVTTSAIADYIGQSSRFVDRNQLDDLNRLSLTFGQVAEFARRGEAGLADFLTSAAQRGEVEIMNTTLHELADVADLTNAQLIELSEDGHVRLANGQDLVIGRGEDLIRSMRQEIDVTQELARAELDRIAGRDENTAAIVGAMEAINGAATGETDYTAALEATNALLDPHTSSLEQATQALEEYRAATDEGKAAVEEALGINVALDEALVRGQEAISRAADAALEYGTNLDTATEGGRRNRDTIRQVIDAAQDHAAAIVRQTGDTQLATEVVNGYVQSLYDTYGQTEETRAMLQEYLATLGLTPETVETIVRALGTEEATRLMELVRQKAEQIPGLVTTTVEAWIDEGKYAEAERLLNALARTRTATIAAGTDNRYVGVTKPSADGGIYQYFAQGGFSENHIAQILPAGTNRVWAEPETGGESYIPLAPAKRAQSLKIWEQTGHELGVRPFGTVVNLNVSLGGLTVTIPNATERDATAAGQLVGSMAASIVANEVDSLARSSGAR